MSRNDDGIPLPSSEMLRHDFLGEASSRSGFSARFLRQFGADALLCSQRAVAAGAVDFEPIDDSSFTANCTFINLDIQLFGHGLVLCISA